MGLVTKLRRAVLAQIRGTSDHRKATLAAEKRRLEKLLRAAGWSRNAAKAEIAHRLGSAKKPDSS